MADAQRKASTSTSTVASCAATDCTHNENRSCQAGEVEIEVRDGRATCATYSSETPKARP